MRCSAPSGACTCPAIAASRTVFPASTPVPRVSWPNISRWPNQCKHSAVPYWPNCAFSAEIAIDPKMLSAYYWHTATEETGHVEEDGTLHAEPVGPVHARPELHRPEGPLALSRHRVRRDRVRDQYRRCARP